MWKISLRQSMWPVFDTVCHGRGRGEVRKTKSVGWTI